MVGKNITRYYSELVIVFKNVNL